MLRRGRLDLLARVDSKLARTTGWYAPLLDRVPGIPPPVEDENS